MGSKIVQCLCIPVGQRRIERIGRVKDVQYGRLQCGATQVFLRTRCRIVCLVHVIKRLVQRVGVLRAGSFEHFIKALLRIGCGCFGSLHVFKLFGLNNVWCDVFLFWCRRFNCPFGAKVRHTKRVHCRLATCAKILNAVWQTLAFGLQHLLFCHFIQWRSLRSRSFRKHVNGFATASIGLASGFETALQVLNGGGLFLSAFDVAKRHCVQTIFVCFGQSFV